MGFDASRPSQDMIESLTKDIRNKLDRLGCMLLSYAGEKPEVREKLEEGLPVTGHFNRWSDAQMREALDLALKEVAG